MGPGISFSAMGRSANAGGHVAVAISVALSLVILGSAASLAQGDDPRRNSIVLDSIDVNVVNVEVFVSDNKGNPVGDLEARDFELREDGKKVKITHFAVVGEAVSDAPEASDDPSRTPLCVVLFIDDFTIDPATREAALEDLRGFVHRDRESDVVYAVAKYDGRLSIVQPFTTDRDEILEALRDLGQPNALGVMRRSQRNAVLREGLELMQAIRQLVGSETRQSEISRYLADYGRQVDSYAERLRQTTGGSFYALSHLANALGSLPGRKAVVYLSDGLPARPGQELYHALSEMTHGVNAPVVTGPRSLEDMDNEMMARSRALNALESGSRRPSGKGGGQPSEDLRMLTALANSGGVSFYSYKAMGAPAVDAGMSGEAAEIYTPLVQGVREDNLAETLRSMADETGGVAVIGGSVDALMERAHTDFSQRYSLGFEPRHQGDGEYHAIKVKAKGRGLKLRYRTGYVDKPTAVRLADRASTALLLGLEENPLGVTLEVGPARQGDQGKYWLVPITLGVPMANLSLMDEGGVFALDAPLFIAARSELGDLAPVQEAMLRIEVEADDLERARGEMHTTRFELALGEGAQRLAVGFVDPVAAVSSFVSRDILVGEMPGDSQ